MKNSQNTARRLILRSLVMGGGATIAGKMLPDSWVKPTVNAILTPAHAQTSGVNPTGFFQTGAIVVDAGFNNGFNSFADSTSSSTGKSVLDFFITPAEATPTEVYFCESNAAPSIQLSFGAPSNPGSVQVCIVADGSSYSGASNISGTSIDPFSVNFDSSSSISFSNLVANDTQLSGEFLISGESNVSCSSEFSAPKIDGMFGCTPARSDGQ